MRRAIIGASALVLILSGCEMRAELDINDDGSGTFGFALAVERELLANVPGGEEEFFANAKTSFDADPVPWQVSEFEEPGMRGVRALLPFKNVDHLREMMAKVDGGSERGGFDDGFALQRTAKGWRLDAKGEAPNFDPFSQQASGELPPELAEEMPSGMEGLFGGGASQGLDALLRFELAVTLPGSATSHNADVVRSANGKTTFVWRPEMSSTEPVSMKAETVGGGGGIPVVPVAVAIGVLALGAFLLGRRRGAPGGPPPVVLEGLPALQTEPATVSPQEEPPQDQAAAGG